MARCTSTSVSYTHLAFFQGSFGVGHGIVGGWAVADTDQCGGLVDGEVRGVLAEIVPAGGLHAVALVAIEVGVAVEFHDISLGILFLHLRRKQNLHDLSRKGLLLGQVGVLHHLLGDGASALGDRPAVLDQEMCIRDRPGVPRGGCEAAGKP